VGDRVGRFDSEPARYPVPVRCVARRRTRVTLNLIECNSPGLQDLVNAGARTAASLPGVSVVSMSFGSSEFASEQSLDGNFTTPSGHQGVTFVASTGDGGSAGEYPACSPNVMAIGGTSLYVERNALAN
jgi:Subtilase family